MILRVLKSGTVELKIAGCVAVCGGVDQGRGGCQEANMRLMAYERRRRDSRSSLRYQISPEDSHVSTIRRRILLQDKASQKPPKGLGKNEQIEAMAKK